MTRTEVDTYFAERMRDQTFREALFSYFEFYGQDAWKKFKNEAVTDGDRAYFQGVGKGADAIRNYFETVSGTQKVMEELKAQIEAEKKEPTL